MVLQMLISYLETRSVAFLRAPSTTYRFMGTLLSMTPGVGHFNEVLQFMGARKE